MATQVDLTTASRAVRSAKRALKYAEYRFDNEVTPGNTSMLIAEIMEAERRLADATAFLRKLARSQ